MPDDSLRTVNFLIFFLSFGSGLDTDYYLFLTIRSLTTLITEFRFIIFCIFLLLFSKSYAFNGFLISFKSNSARFFILIP
jgi:hypothetical protein